MEKEFKPFVDASVIGFKNAMDALLFLSSFFHYFDFTKLSDDYLDDLHRVFNFMLDESKNFTHE